MRPNSCFNSRKNDFIRQPIHLVFCWFHLIRRSIHVLRRAFRFNFQQLHHSRQGNCLSRHTHRVPRRAFHVNFRLLHRSRRGNCLPRHEHRVLLQQFQVVRRHNEQLRPQFQINFQGYELHFQNKSGISPGIRSISSRTLKSPSSIPMKRFASFSSAKRTGISPPKGIKGYSAGVACSVLSRCRVAVSTTMRACM